MLHIHVIIGGPNTSIRRALYFSTFRYQIGRYHYTLNDIKHGILRGNLGAMSSKAEHFTLKKDPRRSYSFPIDGRIHAALTSFTMSGPIFREFTAESLEDELTKAFHDYISKEVEIDLVKMKIALPKPMQWYKEDFSTVMHDSPSAVDFEWIHELLEAYLLEGATREKFSKYSLDVEPFIEYSPFNWNHNFHFQNLDLSPILIPLEEAEDSGADEEPGTAPQNTST